MDLESRHNGPGDAVCGRHVGCKRAGFPARGACVRLSPCAPRVRASREPRLVLRQRRRRVVGRAALELRRHRRCASHFRARLGRRGKVARRLIRRALRPRGSVMIAAQKQAEQLFRSRRNTMQLQFLKARDPLSCEGTNAAQLAYWGSNATLVDGSDSDGPWSIFSSGALGGDAGFTTNFAYGSSASNPEVEHLVKTPIVAPRDFRCGLYTTANRIALGYSTSDDSWRGRLFVVGGGEGENNMSTWALKSAPLHTGWRPNAVMRIGCRVVGTLAQVCIDRGPWVDVPGLVTVYANTDDGFRPECFASDPIANVATFRMGASWVTTGNDPAGFVYVAD